MFFFIIPQLNPAKSMTYLVDKESHIIKYLDKFLWDHAAPLSKERHVVIEKSPRALGLVPRKSCTYPLETTPEKKLARKSAISSHPK